MKRIALFFLLTLFILTPSAFSQDDDWYRPGGFDAIGRSYKTFSVSDTKKVHFSRGNLQYNASQNKWRFALRQYNYSCGDNTGIAQNYDGWMDLFRYGTSGWNNGATYYQPWSTGGSSSDYTSGNLTGAKANADWGVYNKISNGGNKAGQWRTLTSDEWCYLLDLTGVGSNASAGIPSRQGKCGFGTIEGMFRGLIVLPDDWVLPSGCSFTPVQRDVQNEFAFNTYTYAEWDKMQNAGAIFLPAAGDLYGEELLTPGVYGAYWTAAPDANNSSSCQYVTFRGDTWSNLFLDVQGANLGMSVRLVADENPNVSKAFDLEGASYKTFSVADGRTVHFSKGNLRYNAATNTWAFAAKQYLYIGDANNNISESYNGWIDLFGWGTSGWNSGATAFQPWSTSTTTTDYSPGGYDTVDLTGDYAQADWGVYNKITNGGNKAGKWRTLTYEEWEYLIDRSGKYGMATIGGTYKGMVLLPDDWTLPSGVTFTAGYGNGYSTNSYTTTQWQKMEAAGAIFLPAAANRYASTINDAGTYGFYYTSSHYNENSVWYIYFGESNVAPQIQSRSYGRSVRLVKD